MKKQIVRLTLAFLLVLFAVNYAFAQVALKFGLDTSGDHEFSGYGLTASTDVEDGFSACFEFVGAINNNFEMGAGITWQSPRAQEEYLGDFYFIPFYGLIKIRSASEKVAPYFIGQFGINFIFEGDTDYKGAGIYAANLRGDLYYGAGAGIIFYNRFQIEALYSVNKGTAHVLYSEFDIEYSKVTLSLGVIF